jgi:hypothetical protein
MLWSSAVAVAMQCTTFNNGRDVIRPSSEPLGRCLSALRMSRYCWRTQFLRTDDFTEYAHHQKWDFISPKYIGTKMPTEQQDQREEEEE